MMFGLGAYIIGSLVTYRRPYNLDQMLHRGKYAESAVAPVSVWSRKGLYSKLIGITAEYSRGDRVIAWSVFFYSVVYQFGIAFVGVLIWNFFDPLSPKWWSWYFFITIVVVGIITGIVSTVWFMIGGVIDLRQLFKDLASRVDNPLDDGWVKPEYDGIVAAGNRKEGK